MKNRKPSPQGNVMAKVDTMFKNEVDNNDKNQTKKLKKKTNTNLPFFLFKLKLNNYLGTSLTKIKKYPKSPLTLVETRLFAK